MKKKFLLFTLVAGLGSVIILSNTAGPAHVSQLDCTGAETGTTTNPNPAGCAAPGFSCHSTSASTGITLAIELDSAGVATTHYKGGLSYTIKITGTNNTTSTNLSKFGFQLGVITGSSAAATPANAGSFGSLPSNTRSSPALATFYVVNIIEHSTQLSPASGTGGAGTTYVESIPWTAPAAGTGTISIWSALNAVNDNGVNDAGDLWNTNHEVITEETTTSVINVMNNINVTAYPNPVSAGLQLQMNGAVDGNYSLAVFSLNGACIANENLAVNSNSYHTTINTTIWAPGMYTIVVTKDGNSKVIPIVKQ